MALVEQLVEQIQRSFIEQLQPSPARKISEIEKNQFGQARWGEGTIVFCFNAAGHPLTMKIAGVDDLAILEQGFVDHVRTIAVGDVETARELSVIFEMIMGSALVLDEAGRRRIRRAAASPAKTADGGDVLDGFVRDRRTGEIRSRLLAGRRKNG